MSAERRGAAARLGIAALNVPWPGLGLLRLGEGRLAARFIGLPFLLLFAVFAWYVFGPELTAASWLALMLLVVVGYVGAIVAAAAICWRRSAERRTAQRWWSRWYGILAVWVAALGGTFLLPDPQSFYGHFYVPSRSMEPTLVPNDRIVARMRNIGPLERGQVVLVAAPRGGIYVNRIAALPGDSIAMVRGIVVINGRPVPQRLIGVEPSREPPAPGPARRLAERCPGEAGEHQIYDQGPTPADDFHEITVPPERIFLLGDNRDDSADSRVPADEAGLELVPVGNVVGRPLFFTWWPGQRLAGHRIAD